MVHMVDTASQAAAPAQTTAKPRAPKAPRAAAKPAAKPAAKAKVRPAAKAAARPAAKPAAKAAAKAKPSKPATKTAKAAAPAKVAKVKLVRDSFTMPSDEYALLDQLKQRALAGAHHAKKSELLRAGVKLLASLDAAALLRALAAVPAVKTGRPKAKKGE